MSSCAHSPLAPGLTCFHSQPGLGQNAAGHADGLALVRAGVGGLDLGDGDGTPRADRNPAWSGRGLAREQQRLERDWDEWGRRGGDRNGMGMGMGTVMRIGTGTWTGMETWTDTRTGMLMSVRTGTGIKAQTGMGIETGMGMRREMGTRME